MKSELYQCLATLTGVSKQTVHTYAFCLALRLTFNVNLLHPVLLFLIVLEYVLF